MWCKVKYASHKWSSVAYTFNVTAANSAGTSLPSAPSNSVTPSAGAVTLQLVQSRKFHGTVPPLVSHDLQIDATKAISQAVTVEPRDSRGGHTLIFSFNTTITSIASASAIGPAGPIGTVYAVPSGNTIVAYLLNVPDNSRVTILLNGVNGTTNVTTSMGFLVGDINSTRSVNSADVSRIKASLNQPTAAGNYLLDLNLSGTINAGDLAMVKARSGLVLP